MRLFRLPRKRIEAVRELILDDLDILLGLDLTYGLKKVLKRLVTFKYIKS